ncbi:hypothetical protein ON010_g16821 [Phytophthora cinnamomi]|nr:hypothetical protein ON010_g16821 [Phytophthora cinnamomi]
MHFCGSHKKTDIYYAALRTWAFREDDTAGASPISPHPSKRAPKTGSVPPGWGLRSLIGECLVPDSDAEQEMQQYRERHTSTLLCEMACWRNGNVLEIRLNSPIPYQPWTRRGTDIRFWPTFLWNDNPGLREIGRAVLTGKKYHRIRECTLAELHIQRTGVAAYSTDIPSPIGETKHHTGPKLGRWGLAILLGYPSLEIAEEMRVQQELYLRHQPELQYQYLWKTNGQAEVSGLVLDEQQQEIASLRLRQKDPYASQILTNDVNQLRGSGLVVKAHPWTH